MAGKRTSSASKIAWRVVVIAIVIVSVLVIGALGFVFWGGLFALLGLPGAIVVWVLWKVLTIAGAVGETVQEVREELSKPLDEAEVMERRLRDAHYADGPRDLAKAREDAVECAACGNPTWSADRVCFKCRRERASSHSVES